MLQLREEEENDDAVEDEEDEKEDETRGVLLKDFLAGNTGWQGE